MTKQIIQQTPVSQPQPPCVECEKRKKTENKIDKPKNDVIGPEKYRFPRGWRNYTQYKRDKAERQQIMANPGPFFIDNQQVTKKQMLERKKLENFEIIDAME